MASFCIICCKPAENSGQEKEKESFIFRGGGGGESKLLNNHLLVYFVGKKLLKLSDHQCLEILSLLASEGAFNECIPLFCLQCLDIVAKAGELHNEILTLHRKIDRWGTTFSKLVAEDSNDALFASSWFKQLRHVLAHGDVVTDISIVKLEVEATLPSHFLLEAGDLGENSLQENYSDEFLNEILSDVGSPESDRGVIAGHSQQAKRKHQKMSCDDSDSDYSPVISISTKKDAKKEVKHQGSSKYTNVTIDRSKSRFPCKFCKTIYTSPHGFKRHLLAHEESERLGHKFECPVCKHPNLSEETLRRHMTKQHETQKNTCKICGHVALRRHLHEKHMLKQHNIQVWAPMDDNNVPKNEHEGTIDCPLKNREMPSHNNESCSEAKDFITVETEDASVDNNGGNNFQCKKCDSLYTTSQGYGIHMRVHKKSDLLGNIFDCTICQHPNTSEKSLRRHATKMHMHEMATKDEIQKLKRNVDFGCIKPKQETIEGNSQKHELEPFTMQQDTPITKSFCCTRCESVYTSIPGFRRHMRVHKQSDNLQNKYDCMFCRHPNMSENSLRRHLSQIHNKNLANIDNLTMNDQSDELVSLSTNQPQMDFFKSEDALPHSSQKPLGNDKRFRCKLCKSVYTSLSGIKKHIRAHRESKKLGNVFNCEICDHPNTSKRELHRHMTRFHFHRGSTKVPHEVIHSNEAMLEVKKENEDLDEDSLAENTLELKHQSQDYDDKSLSSNLLTRPRRSLLLKSVLVEDSSDEQSKESDDDDWKPDVDRSNSERKVTSDEEEESGSDSDVVVDADFGILKKGNSYTTNASGDLFKCSKCSNVTYKSARGMKTHMREHSISIKLNHKFDCKKCKFPCSSERRLRCHIKRVHNEKPMCTCTVCGFQVSRPIRLKLHMRKHNPGYGMRKAGRPAKWLSHMNSKGVFECQLCKANYGSADTLKRHLEQHEKSKLNGGKYDCDICTFPCTNERQLRSHKNVRHEKTRPTCEICNKSFGRPNILRAHLRVHEQYDKLVDPITGQYKCKYCPYQGSLAGLIVHKTQSHKDVADPSESYLCSECGLGFTTQATLRGHIKNKHENQYRYRCELCGHGFEAKNTLRSHMKTHEVNRTREFICNICGVAYSYKKTLDDHMVRYHPEDPSSRKRSSKTRPQNEGRFCCKFCAAVFPFKYLLVNHMPDAHKDLYRFKCDQCEKSYMSASSLKLHREISHSNGNFSCEYCGKAFPHKHYVICHYRFCQKKKEIDGTSHNPCDKDKEKTTDKEHEKKFETEQNSQFPGSSCRNWQTLASDEVGSKEITGQDLSSEAKMDLPTHASSFK